MSRPAIRSVRSHLAIVFLVTVVLGWGLASPDRSSPAAPTNFPLPPAPYCPVTLPNGSVPPGEPPSPGYHGNGTLWTALWPNGRVVFESGGPESVEPDGSLAITWPGWWAGRGQLVIAGWRLDAPAPPLRAEAPGGRRLDVPPPRAIQSGAADSSTTGFQPSALIFPTAGCWRVTGQVGTGSRTVVMLVVKVGAGAGVCPRAAIRDGGAAARTIARCGTVDPAGFVRIYHAVRAGDLTAAQAEHARILRLSAISSLGPADHRRLSAAAFGAFKTALMLRGVIATNVMGQPLARNDAAAAARVRAVLVETGPL